MKKLLPKLLYCSFVLLAYSLIKLLHPALVFACPSGTIDLLDYYLPSQSNTTVEVHHYDASGTDKGTVEHFYTYSDTASNGDDGFYFIKSEDPTYFEEFSYDDEYIYHLKDTTWTEKCPDGGEAFYTLFEGNLGENGCANFEANKEGVRWVKRCLAEGETSGPFTSTLLGFNKESCDCCLSQPSSETRKLSYKGPHRFNNGWESPDLIILESPSNGEKYFVDRRYGMIGFEGAGFRTWPFNVENSSRDADIVCELTTKKEGVTIVGYGPGVFDGDVKFENQHTNETALAPQTPTSDQVLASFLGLFERNNAAGSIEYHEVNFPNFGALSKVYRHALSALLPDATKPSLAGSVETKITTRVYPYTGENLSQLDEDAGTTCEEGAQHKQTVSGAKWGQAASATIGINLLQPENQISEKKFFKKFAYQAETVGFFCPPGFGPGDEADDDTKPPKPEPVKPSFILSRLTVIQELLEEIIDLVTNLIKQKIRERYKVKIVFDSIVPMADKSSSYAKSLGISLSPQKESKKWEPKDEAKALTVVEGAKVGVTLSPEEEGYHPIIYGSLGTFRNYNCLAVCGSYPESVTKEGSSNLIGKNKICPSCNYKDYEGPKAKPRTPCKNPDGSPDWTRNPQECVPEGCNWNPNYFACDYYYICKSNPNIPHCNGEGGKIEFGCAFGQDPVCEDCNGIPNELYSNKDLAWCGGAGGERSCEAHPCQYLNRTDYQNDTYSDPRYNGCYYANATVKVKREGSVSCTSVCNDACPAY
ncbi:MAG TPA: hypothetical protein VMW41_02530 [Candidatus Bathyarchaeia archaeon]|nr:hypothetical protein [Candidatus Bathyarchaeia archaeon]